MADTIEWDLEREACDDHLKMTYEWGKEKWVGDKLADEALKELEKWEVDCPIESGKSAAKEWLRRKQIEASKGIEAFSETLDDRQKRHEEINQRIHKTQDTLLTNARQALHRSSPMWRRFNKMEFFMMWHDFEPCILSQIVPDVENSRRLPAHLLVMHQGVYREFISRKKFKDGELINLEGYREIILNEPKNLIPVEPKLIFGQIESLHEHLKNRITYVFSQWIIRLIMAILKLISC